MKTNTKVRLVEVVGQCHDPRCGATWRCWTDRAAPPGGQPCPSCQGDNTTEQEA